MKAHSALAILINAVFLALPLAAAAQSQQLDAPVVQQEHSEWCWDADATAVLTSRQLLVTQCAIANWVDSTDYACGSYPFYWNAPVNSPNYLAGTTGIAGILWSWGRRSSSYYAPLAYRTVRSAIQGGDPIVILWSWRGGGGHFVVLDGYDDDGPMLYFMNPWPGEGAEYGDYGWVRSGSAAMGTHWWTESLITY
jgi:Papain-like cysteine protease AvrRpt2